MKALDVVIYTDLILKKYIRYFIALIYSFPFVLFCLGSLPIVEKDFHTALSRNVNNNNVVPNLKAKKRRPM